MGPITKSLRGEGIRLTLSATVEKVEKVVNVPPGKKIPEGKPSSQNNRKWVWFGCVIGASIVFRGPSSGQWPCNRNVFLTLITFCIFLNYAKLL